MPVVEARDKQEIRGGTVYFAPAGYHLLVETTRTFALSVGPRVCHCRPSVDVLFQSASAAYQHRLAAIVLSGANPDGAAGVAQVVRARGIVLVQDPSDAEAEQMPSAALSSARVDFVGSVRQIRHILEGMEPSHGRSAIVEHTRSR
jgi:two-component system chemotaxis response regulator CheB